VRGSSTDLARDRQDGHDLPERLDNHQTLAIEQLHQFGTRRQVMTFPSPTATSTRQMVPAGTDRCYRTTVDGSQLTRRALVALHASFPSPIASSNRPRRLRHQPHRALQQLCRITAATRNHGHSREPIHRHQLRINCAALATDLMLARVQTIRVIVGGGR
jgi:hypothetical protein